MNLELIIAGLENFYDLWSDGVSGGVIAVQKRLADLETLSIQTVKSIIKNPTALRYSMSYEMALEEKAYFEQTGLKCKIVHAGPELLDQYSNSEIENFIIRHVGILKSAYIQEFEPNTYTLKSKEKEVVLDYNEEHFFLYLACLRYLARNGRFYTNCEKPGQRAIYPNIIGKCSLTPIILKKSVML